MTNIDSPIVVDLDGTLTPVDTLAESILSIIKQSPVNLLRLFFRLMKGRAAFKRFVAKSASFSADNLPYREPLLEYLRNEKEKGRRIVLATASHRIVADKVSTYLDIFDEVLATENDTNLKGKNKLRAIRDQVGESFVYAGDNDADIPIWQSANAAILVAVSPSVDRVVRATTPIEIVFPRGERRLRVWLRALRIHQWLKNLLIFVPALTAFSFLEFDNLTTLTIAFLSFSFVASATYLVNDLWDLNSDRAHARKSGRPLASGQISAVDAVGVSFVFLFSGLIGAWVVSPQFLLIALLYVFSTSCYSWVLKQYVLIDVIALSLLYTLRIFAGSVAIGVSTSTWLMAFSVFLFLSLALVKRCSELISIENGGGDDATGRDYRVSDLTVLWPLGIATAVSAVVVFGLFISAPETVARYQVPYLLWLVALGLMYWLSRLWIVTARGEMHDDPVVYAVMDNGSRAAIIVMIATVIVAHYVDFGVLL